MKILHLIQKPQLRGAEIFTSQLAAHLTKMGHEAVIVSVFDGDAQLPFSGKHIRLKGNQTKRYFDLKAWKDLASIIKNEKPDIIQANAGDTLKYAVFSKLLFNWKQPVVFRNASTISLYIKTGFVKKLYRFLFGNTKKIISVSKASALDFGHLYPVYKNKIVTIPIGIEGEEKIENKMFRNPFDDVQSTRPILLHVGGFTFEKNHSGLLNIFSEVVKAIPSAQLHLVGDGPLRTEIERLVNQKKLNEKVIFHGYQQEPLQWIQFADALLLPSHIEGLPGVILEAFYCKTPVIAFNVGGIGEIVKDGKTGYLTPKGNEALFAENVIQAIQNRENSEMLADKAYKLVTREYMNAEVAKAFLNIYQTL